MVRWIDTHRVVFVALVGAATWVLTVLIRAVGLHPAWLAATVATVAAGSAASALPFVPRVGARLRRRPG